MKTTTEIMAGAEPIIHQGSGTGILMLHGFTASPAQFKEYARFFIDKGFTVHAPLLDGHGTHVDQLNKCVWNDWYATAKNHLFEMRHRCNKIFVIGQSMGGTLALHLAAHYLLEGLVLLAPAMKFKSRLPLLAPVVAPFKPRWKKKGGADIQNLKSRNESINYDAIPLRALRELKKMMDHVQDDLQDVHIPVLIAHSIHDHTIDFKGSKDVYEKISSKSKSFLELKNSYHILSLDNDKDVVLRESETFIRKHGGTGRVEQLD